MSTYHGKFRRPDVEPADDAPVYTICGPLCDQQHGPEDHHNENLKRDEDETDD